MKVHLVLGVEYRPIITANHTIRRNKAACPMHPIYALWSHPRSMSTAIERIMRERGDLDCAHEPFMYDYYVHRQVRVMPHFDVRPDHPASYPAIRDMLLQRAKAGPVFIKDMSYYVMPHILDDKDFSTRLINAFLIRDPMAAITSYYKLDPDLTLEEIGLAAQWRHFNALRATTGTIPAVIEADTVRANTKRVIAMLWQHMGLSFLSRAFDWQQETPGDWAQVQAWHGDVTTSKGIRPVGKADTTQKQKNFDALVKKAPHLTGYLDDQQVYYKKLKAFALNPQASSTHL